eukprot:GDKJ01023928.1.p1 GENE.GDKJ01023928.1~~GDKJ01023928.1.p1  ORF type:complete len:149 (+),score=30.03 GDKJ01023928.1:1-447(+)
MGPGMSMNPPPSSLSMFPSHLPPSSASNPFTTMRPPPIASMRPHLPSAGPPGGGYIMPPPQSAGPPSASPSPFNLFSINPSHMHLAAANMAASNPMMTPLLSKFGPVGVGAMNAAVATSNASFYQQPQQQSQQQHPSYHAHQQPPQNR